MLRRAALIFITLCATLTATAAQDYTGRAGMRSEEVARNAALEACQRTGDSCSIYAVDDGLESARTGGARSATPAAPAQ